VLLQSWTGSAAFLALPFVVLLLFFKLTMLPYKTS
jgi:hypothetical protein